MKKYTLTIITCFYLLCVNADVIDFSKSSALHNGKLLVDDVNWSSTSKTSSIKFYKDAISVDKDSKLPENIVYNKVFTKDDLPLTISTDFTYEQFNDLRGKDILRLGFFVGKEKVYGVFNRYGYGDYVMLSTNTTPKGYPVEIENMGFKNNSAVGKSLPAKLSVTLQKNKNSKLSLYVSLKVNDKLYGFDCLNTDLKDSDLKNINAFIEFATAETSSGIRNILVSSFEIDKKPADKMLVNIPTDIDFRDYILPMQPVKPLVKTGVWGEAILPRDTSNGLESAKPIPHYCYWDGAIVKDKKGKYHMYASRWSQSFPHGTGWKTDSKGIHAVSEGGVEGPYIDKGIIYPHWQGGKGSNVIGLEMFDGRYAVVTSEITKGEVFISDNPDGPFELAGEIQVDNNGFNPGLAKYNGGNGNMSNVQIIKRHDGRYMIVPRSSAILISEGDITGPYKIMSNRVYNNMPEIPQRCMEDPTAWYSGGMYHMLINHWPSDTTYYFSSIDGINDWKYRGIAFKKHTGIFRYTDGTENDWAIVQRPTVFLEDGHVSQILFSVIDVTKGADNPNDTHGSKIIVVPFDGKAFDAAMQKLVEK